MCRHKGIGMNRPKKTKVEVPQFLKVALLLNGWALDVQEAPEEKRRKRSPRMMELSVQRRVICACEKWTRFCQKQHDKAVLRSSKAVAGLDACMSMLPGSTCINTSNLKNITEMFGRCVTAV